MDFDYTAGTVTGDFSYLQIQNDNTSAVQGTARAINSLSTLPSVFAGDLSANAATFASTATATRFIGVKNENYISTTTNRTLIESDYNLNSGVSASTTITVPTGLSINRSWELTSSGFSFTIVAASGVTITIINNSEANDLVIQGKHSAKLVATSTANQFLLIKY